MERAIVGLPSKIKNVFFPTIKPKVPALRFHINSSYPFQVNQALLSAEDKQQIDQALARVGICASVSSLNELLATTNRDRSFKGRVLSRFHPQPDSQAEDFMLPRVARFIQNYATARLLMHDGKYRPKAVVAGKSGLYNALAIESVSLEDSLVLVYEEAKAVEDARKGGLYTDLEKPQDFTAPLYTQNLERFLGEFQNVVDQLEINKTPIITIIGSAGKKVATLEEIKREIVRQAIRPYEEQVLDDVLALLHILRPLEIGLEPKDGKRKYLIGATVIGIGGAMAILALRRYRSSRQSK